MRWLRAGQVSGHAGEPELSHPHDRPIRKTHERKDVSRNRSSQLTQSARLRLTGWKLAAKAEPAPGWSACRVRSPARRKSIGGNQ